MNYSSASSNSTPAVVRDDLNTAILKNVITVGLCISINYINVTLVLIFMKHETLNSNPRYILYIHLVLNDIIVLTIVTIIQVLTYAIFTLNVSLCIVLAIIGMYTSINNPMTLGIMAIECYIAVCFPLRHSQICTVRKTYIGIGFIWITSSLTLLPDLFFTLATEPLEFFYSRVLCLRSNIFRNPRLTEKNVISNAVLLAFVWLTLLYTYFKILFTAKAASADAKKARNTVLLHSFQLMLSMLTYLNNPLIAGLAYLFPNSVLTILYAAAIFVNVLPRLISPLVYGIREKAFRKYLKQYLFCWKNCEIKERALI